jgi:cyclopropane fatty-acyl-phospholipid synthase-like methyltransferase
MQVATGATMLNFGYWQGDIYSPVEAQYNLCTLIGKTAELGSSKSLIDIGSGYGAPALIWSMENKLSDVICVNINFQQLQSSKNSKMAFNKIRIKNSQVLLVSPQPSQISNINSTSISLPIANNTVDRIIALESAQHFKPFDRFMTESYRILQHKGLLVIAMPVTVYLNNYFKKIFSLGILNLTWSSEHYTFEYIKSAIRTNGFSLREIITIGKEVYKPLTLYYIQNRKKLREKILSHYPSYIEKILYRSLMKMMTVSEKGLIDYIVIKAQKLS